MCSLIITYSYCKITDVSKDLISRLLLIGCNCYCHYSYRVRKRRSPREDESCLIPVYSVDTVWENRNHKNLIRLIRSKNLTIDSFEPIEFRFTFWCHEPGARPSAPRRSVGRF
ncbi:hypothetical protein T4D_7419 [Trichinella pseudospiralis]|uniref:Uncharacterized protein n=1 Tax=Trichinella pseudospiralis TaxID=6337 RepID=A0A0V1FZB0_TRIPS|nr:hypothetical protein T4D_7419 [Trichinella pseudospiralis]